MDERWESWCSGFFAHAGLGVAVAIFSIGNEFLEDCDHTDIGEANASVETYNMCVKCLARIVDPHSASR